MKVEPTKLEGVLTITPPTIFEDFRGNYIETYNEALYQEAGIKVKFIQDDISTSSHHVLRGVHGDQETWKLVSCHYGEFYLLVVNCDPKSSQYRQWQGFTLSDKNHLQVLIPPKFGNAHVVLSDQAVFHYKQSTYYNRAGQFTIPWNDAEFIFSWPIENPIISERDHHRDGI